MQGYTSSQITVLTTYSGQLFQFKRSFLKKDLQGVRFTVVDNFQGEESDIVLISFVRSNEEGEIGFLKISNRVCVALSRARKGLFCIGNFELLAEKCDLWKNIVETLESNKSIGPSILLTCQNHPDINKAVTNEKDFDFVPEGGCTQQCKYRLLCGHLCFLKCHPYDPMHKEIQCPKPCLKQCSEGHMCAMKCFEECPPCTVLVSKTIEKCGHNIQVPCHLHKKITPCTEPCDKFLSCGHECPGKCGNSCPSECFIKVPIPSPVCNHEVNIECSKSKDIEFLMLRCKEPCHTELPCGHKCSGSCGSCYQGRLHVACFKPCKRKLVCGHDCKSECYRNCPPCDQPCENYCLHRKCTKKCCEPCEKCTKPCEWICRHKKCTRFCSERCNRTKCNEPCPKLLKCKHPCIGVCGEVCPVECRVCDMKKLEEVCFGRNIEADTMFVCLEDCHHVFELNWLKQWMSQESPKENEIRCKACPKCKVVIRKPFHIENNTESCFKNIEKIKKAVTGNKDYNDDFKEILRQRSEDLIRDASLSNFKSGWDKLKEFLDSKKERDIQELCTMENMINIMKIWPGKQYSSLCRILRYPGSKLRHYLYSDDYINETKKWLESFVTKRFLTASEQQLKDILWEVHRLKLINLLQKIKAELIHRTKNADISSDDDNWVVVDDDSTSGDEDRPSVIDDPTSDDEDRPSVNDDRTSDNDDRISEDNDQTLFESDDEDWKLDNDQKKHMNKLIDLVLTYSPFREVELTEFISVLQDLSKIVPELSINTSELQQNPILTIMSFSEGHWFLCGHGHVYSAVKCGNATQEYLCYECDRKIVDITQLLPKVNQPPKYRPSNQRGRSNRGRKSFNPLYSKSNLFNTFHKR